MNVNLELSIQYAAFVLSLINQVGDICTLVFASNINKALRYTVACISVVVCCACAYWVVSTRVVADIPPLPAIVPIVVKQSQATTAVAMVGAVIKKRAAKSESQSAPTPAKPGEQVAPLGQFDVVQNDGQAILAAPLPEPLSVSTQTVPMPDLSPGPNQTDFQEEHSNGRSGGDSDSVDAAGGESSHADDKRDSGSSSVVGNLVTCAPPNPPNNAWVKLYRLDSRLQWQPFEKSFGTELATGGLVKKDGLPIDIGRFGGRGEPYRVEVWQDGKLIHSTGDFYMGEAEFRIYPDVDNLTPWGCPPA
jgi:hypothetical protein